MFARGLFARDADDTFYEEDDTVGAADVEHAAITNVMMTIRRIVGGLSESACAITAHPRTRRVPWGSAEPELRLPRRFGDERGRCGRRRLRCTSFVGLRGIASTIASVPILRRKAASYRKRADDICAKLK